MIAATIHATRVGTCLAVLALLAAAGLTLAAGPAASDSRTIDWARAKSHWSFRPLQAHRSPAVVRRAWPREPVDAFILARLESRHRSPSPEADRRTLIRRVTFDLTGLPPTPEEVEAFLADTRPGAYERLVDRLLASPRFGERMASMWLPLARYAEDQAHQVGSDTKFFYPNAHLYRQWVIDAFNRDLRYDRFVRLQLAADLIPGTEKSDLAALGFIGLGPKYYNRNRLDVQASEWEDRVDTVTRTFLGLTVACARCHDHKFDPITTEDYYALAGVFASTKMVNKTPDGVVDAPTKEAPQMRPDILHIVEEDTPRDLNVFVRGNVEVPGPVVPRRFLRVLSDGEPTPFREGSGRRELADAVADPANPLTARVMVNRLWGLAFGNPLVATPSNFGRLGELPTHPELLDALALRFIETGWSVKSILRELLLSATYRQASAAPAAAPKASSRARPGAGADDPGNELLGRMNRRRLTVEQWRDTLLFVAGELESGGGPSQELTDAANRRRTVYARVSRLKLDDMLCQFDYPDANIHAEKRAVTTTPMQKLILLNSPFVVARARALAARLTAGAAPESLRIRQAHMLLYGRPPDAEEVRLGLEFLCRPDSAGMSRWERYAQVLLAANELIYVD